MCWVCASAVHLWQTKTVKRSITETTTHGDSSFLTPTILKKFDEVAKYRWQVVDFRSVQTKLRVWFVVDLLYNKLHNRSTTNRNLCKSVTNQHKSKVYNKCTTSVHIQQRLQPDHNESKQCRLVWISTCCAVVDSSAANYKTDHSNKPAKTRNPLKFAGVPQTRHQISAVRWAEVHHIATTCGGVLLFKNFFPIVDTCLSCEDISWQSCALVPRWRYFACCIFSEPRAVSLTFQTCILNSH